MPHPDAHALQHSARLVAVLEDDIARAGGWISFVRYMHLALYAQGLGYYTGGAAKLGSSGDFTTAPELTPIFGHALALQLAQALRITGGNIFELGAGSGKLARDILLALEAQGVLPDRYCVLDVSGDLKQRQRALLAQLPAPLGARVTWIDALPEVIDGVVLGNEVLDALPVHLVVWREDGMYERGVSVIDGRLAFQDRILELPALIAQADRIDVPRPYVSEIALAATALMRDIAPRLRRALVLFIDYGFGEAEYFHPQRNRGTLMCHYRHRAHDDPFFHPGLQDITAHVNFTAIAAEGVDAGLSMAGYTTQARFLSNVGVTDLLARLNPGSADYARALAPVQKLLSPAEMGELFKVLALTRNIDEPLLGFSAGDLSRLL